jgi:hypothetical protein
MEYGRRLINKNLTGVKWLRLRSAKKAGYGEAPFWRKPPALPNSRITAFFPDKDGYLEFKNKKGKHGLPLSRDVFSTLCSGHGHYF